MTRKLYIHPKTSAFLEVLLSEDLSFSAYIGKISQKASSSLGFISRDLESCPERLLVLAYMTLVKPSLEYASRVWDPHTKLDVDKLEKIQCHTARFVKGYTRYRRVRTIVRTTTYHTDTEPIFHCLVSETLCLLVTAILSFATW